MSLPFCLRAFVLFVVVGMTAGLRPAMAGDLTFLKGKYRGSYTGVLLVSQGKPTVLRAIANADTKVAASKTTANLTIKGTIGSTGYQQVISLKANGQATVNPLIPTGANALNNIGTGTYKMAGKTVTIQIPNPAGITGSLLIRIGFINANSTLSISTVLALKGNETFYSTVIGA